MKIHLKKIVISILLAILFLTGCTGDNSDTNTDIDASTNTDATSSPELSKPSWQDQRLPLGAHYWMVAVTDRMIYGCYEESGVVMVAVQDKASGNIVNQVALPDTTYIQSIDADGEGNIYLIGMQEENSVLWKIDDEGNPSVLESFLLEDLENARHITPKGVYADSEGNLYIWYEMGLPASEFFDDMDDDVYVMADRIYVKDVNLNTMFYVQLASTRDSELLSFALDENGKPTIIGLENGSIHIQEINMAQKGLSTKAHLENISLPGIAENISLIDGGFLFCLGDTLYQFHYDAQDYKKVLNLPSYGIMPNNILYIGMNNNVIELVDYYDYTSKSEYVALVEGTSEKQVLSLGTLQTSVSLEKTVAEFNRFNKAFRIEIIPYYNNGNYEEALEQLKLDIIRGAAPDIIDVSAINYGTLSDKGVFADLYAYMENDEECNADMLIPSIAGAYEINGHLYSISPSFQIYSIWGKNSIINNRSGLTLTELKQMLKSNGKSLDNIYGFSADESVLVTLCTFGMDEFVDWGKGTCDFTGEYFKDILAFAMEYDGGRTEDGLLREIEKGEIVMTVGMISSVADYQIQSNLYQNDLWFVGYPTGRGSGTAVSFSGSELAINAQGKNKDAAWEFVKFYLKSGEAEQGFPIFKDQFDKTMESAMESNIVSYEGEDYEEAKGLYFDGNTYIEVFTAGQDDIDAVRRLVDTATNKFEYNVDILNIIYEEAQDYFIGQKELAQTVDLIQNRVQLYLFEKME